MFEILNLNPLPLSLPLPLPPLFPFPFSIYRYNSILLDYEAPLGEWSEADPPGGPSMAVKGGALFPPSEHERPGRPAGRPERSEIGNCLRGTRRKTKT